MRNESLSHEIFKNIEKLHPRIHAKHLDSKFGYRISKVEEKLLRKYSAYDKNVDASSKKKHFKGTEVWIGLHPQVLQTPYCDIYNALSLINSERIDHVIDVGTGYGRVGLVLSILYPEAMFTGYEIVKQRVLEGNRVYENYSLPNAQIILANVLDSDFELPDANVYFIYDFSERDDVNQVLRKLSEKNTGSDIFLITRGERVDYLMKYYFKGKWKLYKKVNTSDLKIYKSLNAI